MDGGNRHVGSWGADRLIELAYKFYSLGLNVIAIGENKKPLHSWSTTRRLEWEELSGYLRRAIAIALSGFRIEDYLFTSLDIDDVDSGGKILQQAIGDNWRERLCGQPWSLCVKTGPRPKDAGWQCNEEVCVDKDGNTVPIDQVKRGMAIFVRIPIKCAPSATIRGGAIEVLANNYQLVAGRHPSGLQYELISPNYGVGEILSCEEWSRLVYLLKREEDKEKEEKEGEITVRRDCDEVRRLDREEKEALLTLLKQLWRAKDPDTGNNMHDFITFSLSSLAWRHCIAKDDIYELIDKVTQWAIAENIETERGRKEHLYTVDWVYGEHEGRRWGWTKAVEVFRKAAQSVGLNYEVVESLISRALSGSGLSKHDECVRLERDRTNNRVLTWLCNDKTDGIAVVKKTCKQKKKKCEEGEQCKVKCKSVASTVVAAHIEDVDIYVDMYTGTRYINASVVRIDTGERKVYKMARLDEFAEEIDEMYGGLRKAVNWRLIFSTFRHHYGIIADGFVCEDKCRVTSYFGALFDRQNLEYAREALLLLQRASELHPDKDTILTATAYILFTSFSLVQKQNFVKPKMVKLLGPRDTGKTTLAKIIAESFINPETMERCKVVRPASDILTPARVGRLQSQCVLTTPLLLDEVEGMKEKNDVVAVLKSHVTNLIAWSTAHGTKWPAYAGIVMTANRMIFEDPDLLAKIARVEFTSPIPPEAKAEFNNKILPRLRETMPFLASYYLKYAEEHWDEVKDIILNKAIHSWEEAAVEYFTTIAKSLGMDLQTNIMTYEESTNYVELFKRRLMEYIRNYGNLVCKNSAVSICVKTLIELGYVHEVREYIRDEEKYYRIVRNAFGLPTSALCVQIGGEIEKKTRNKLYYGSCIIKEEKFLDIFTQDVDIQEEDS
ncbi:MAG: hypothetical protein QXS16_02090 [Pyrobaculum sp.]